MVSDISSVWMVFGAAFIMMCCGIYSLIATRHLIRVLIALGVMTKALMLMIIAAGWWTERVALTEALIITIVLVEVVVMVVGAGLILGIFHKQGDLDIGKLKNLKG